MKHLINTTLLLLALLLPTLTHAHDFEVDGIYYNINGTTASVTYKGASSYQYQDRYSGSVIIPATVTYNGTTYSVTSIGESAFYDCTSLTTIYIPNSVTSIGNEAFYSCTGLTRVEIPSTITTIGSYAFNRCNKLTSIYIPNSITHVGEGAFEGTPWLDHQPDGLVYIGMVAYKYKGTMPSNTSIALKEGTTEIAGSAFENCNGLININIPISVTTIGFNSFLGCTSLTSIDIPNSVTYIEAYAFDSCTGITNINLSNQLTTIEEGVFSNCINLKEIVIPNSVTAIGYWPFMGCTGLTSVEIPNSVKAIGWSAFQGCSSLTSVEIPNSVTFIGMRAFSGCSSLTSIQLPESVTAIGDQAFSYCTELADIDIPKSVTSIGRNAFENTAWFNNQPDGLVYAGRFAYKYKGEMPENTQIRIKESAIGICGEAFVNSEEYLNNCLIGIEIPNSITIIDEYAFEGCNNLSSLIISGQGDWQADRIPIPNTPKLYIDSHITSIKRIKVHPDSSELYCYATRPPACDENTFTDYSSTLHVPAASLAAYFINPYWSNFSNIIGDAIEPNRIIISEDSVYIPLGSQITLDATIQPTNATPNKILWASSNSSIATVDNNGSITAVGVGECDIVASCDYKQALCHIVVNDMTMTITLDQQEAMLLPNHMLTLTPTSSPVESEGFTANSSDPTVAAARAINGKVQVVGIKEGIATITVGSADGTAIPATCLVTVYTEPGDVNCDGFTNINDITSMIDYLLGSEMTNIKLENADFNSDETIDISDLAEIIDQILKTS